MALVLSHQLRKAEGGRVGAQQPQPLSVHFRLGLGQWRQRRLDWSRLELSNEHVWAVSHQPVTITATLYHYTTTVPPSKTRGVTRGNINLTSYNLYFIEGFLISPLLSSEWIFQSEEWVGCV